MISDEEIEKRKMYYYEGIRQLTHMHHKPPSVTEAILYMSLILKEDPIELAIAIYKIEAERKKDEKQYQKKN
jgi:hypothetical protein